MLCFNINCWLSALLLIKKQSIVGRAHLNVTSLDILPDYVDVVVPIVCTLHVIKTKRMKHLVNYRPMAITSVAQVQNLVILFIVFVVIVANVWEATTSGVLMKIFYTSVNISGFFSKITIKYKKYWNVLREFCLVLKYIFFKDKNKRVIITRSRLLIH